MLGVECKGQYIKVTFRDQSDIENEWMIEIERDWKRERERGKDSSRSFLFHEITVGTHLDVYMGAIKLHEGATSRATSGPLYKTTFSFYHFV